MEEPMEASAESSCRRGCWHHGVWVIWQYETRDRMLWQEEEGIQCLGHRAQHSPGLPYPLSNNPSIDKLSILLYQMSPGRFSPLLSIMSWTLEMIAEKLSPNIISITVPTHSWTHIQKLCFSKGYNQPDLYLKLRLHQAWRQRQLYHAIELQHALNRGILIKTTFTQQ